MSAKIYNTDSDSNTLIESNHFFELQERTSELFKDYYSNGVNDLSVRKALNLSESISDYVTNDKSHLDMIKSFKNYRPYALTHPFLTSVISVMICRRMDWGSIRTIRGVALGALLQNIGMTQMPYHVQTTHPKDLNAEDMITYQSHPEEGIKLLERFSDIPSAVIQIILQHHENNTKGFPMGLPGNRIYPLAKVVRLSDHFVSFLMERDLLAVDGLREFVANKDELSAHDAEMVKGLIKSFTKEK